MTHYAPALRPGATIGIISPCSPITSDVIDPALEVLAARGYKTRFSSHAWDRDGHRAGSGADRASDLMAFYADPTIDIIWCARGGSSACLMREHIDWEALAALPPKLVIGFSDVSSLHASINKLAGVPSIHGPLLFHVGRVIGDEELDWLMRLLEDPQMPRIVPGKASTTLIGGKAVGRFSGGCLSLIRNTIGTPYQVDARDSIFLIEDIDEKPWAVERDLWHLREAGILQTAAGIVVGTITNCDDEKTVPLDRIWSELLAPLNVPTVTGFPFGHVSPNWALPLGCRAELNADEGTLTLLEAPVK